MAGLLDRAEAMVPMREAVVVAQAALLAACKFTHLLWPQAQTLILRLYKQKVALAETAATQVVATQAAVAEVEALRGD
jgi:hypothetical protein